MCLRNLKLNIIVFHTSHLSLWLKSQAIMKAKGFNEESRTCQFCFKHRGQSSHSTKGSEIQLNFQVLQHSTEITTTWEALKNFAGLSPVFSFISFYPVSCHQSTYRRLLSLSIGQTTQRDFVQPALLNSRDISQATRSARQQIYFQRLSLNLHIHKMSWLYFALASYLCNGQRHPVFSMTLYLHCC